MDEEKKEIVAQDIKIGEGGAELDNFQKLWYFANRIVEAKLAPSGMNTSAVAMVLQAGHEAKMTPIEALQSGVVVNGNLSWKGAAIAAMIRESPVCVKGTLDFGHTGRADEMVGWATAHRVGYKQPSRREFTVDDARQARLWGKGGGWQMYPGRMLMWRALGLLARDYFSDVVKRHPMAEEAEDFEPPPAPRRPTLTASGDVKAATVKDPLLAEDVFLKTAAAMAEDMKDRAVTQVTQESTPILEGGDLSGKCEEYSVPQVTQDSTPISLDAHCEHGTERGNFCPECSAAADKGLFEK